MQALLSKLPDDPSSIVITVKSESDLSSAEGSAKRPSTGLLYDPSMVYILELCTVLALRDSETINLLGGDVAEALQNVMRNAPSYHHIMVSRTMYYVLHLLHASYVSHKSSCITITNILDRSNLSFVSRSSSTPYRASKRIFSRNLHPLYFKV